MIMDEGVANWEANAALIVTAVNQHDALKAEADRLTAENARLREALDAAELTIVADRARMGDEEILTDEDIACQDGTIALIRAALEG
jgi:hypothetical protein